MTKYILILALFIFSNPSQAAEFYVLQKTKQKVESKRKTVCFYEQTLLVKIEPGDTLYSIEKEQIEKHIFLGEYVRWQLILIQNTALLPKDILPFEELPVSEFLLISGFSKTFSPCNTYPDS